MKIKIESVDIQADAKDNVRFTSESPFMVFAPPTLTPDNPETTRHIEMHDLVSYVGMNNITEYDQWLRECRFKGVAGQRYTLAIGYRQ